MNELETIDIRTGKPFAGLQKTREHGSLDGASIDGNWGRARGLLGGAFVGCMLAQQSKTYTARDYVQDGLIAMWDAIENAGWGVHDPNATEWPDLITGFSKTSLSAYVWSENSFRSVDPGHKNALANQPREYPKGASVFWGMYNNGTAATWERCHSENAYITGYDLRPALFRTIGLGYVYYYQPQSAFYNGVEQFEYRQPYICPRTGTICNVCDSNGQTMYCNAEPKYGNANVYKKQPLALGRDSVSNGTSKDLYCVRIYNRALTAAEIAHNYAVDKARFGLP